ncbi:MAG: hypothetical protein KF691_07790 [Phycisphaeraceae bacterium]|nr:hypothetical protein [Phycisphaeraceae bacterium]
MNGSDASDQCREEIRRLQESIAFLERRLDEYASVADDLSTRLSQTHKRVAALEAGATQFSARLEKLSESDQSGAGQSE